MTDPKNSKLFHYTHLEAAINILKTKQLWFTNAASREFNIQYEIYPLVIALKEMEEESNPIFNQLKSNLKVDSNNATWFYDFCHELIKFRYNSYIICFTDSEKCLDVKKNIRLELNINGKVTPHGVLGQGSERLSLLTLEHISYGSKNLYNYFDTKIRNHEEILQAQSKGLELFANQDTLKTSLRSAADFFKDGSFEYEKECRLLLYSADQSDFKNLKKSLNTNTAVSRNLSWNKKEKRPQLKILNSKQDANLITRVVCPSEEDAKTILNETSTSCPISFVDKSGNIHNLE